MLLAELACEVLLAPTDAGVFLSDGADWETMYQLGIFILLILSNSILLGVILPLDYNYTVLPFDEGGTSLYHNIIALRR